MIPLEVRTMKQLLKQVLILIVPSLLILALSASASTAPTRRVVRASGPITTLAIDGPRVVYGTDGNGVYVWDVRSGKTARVRRPTKSDSPLVQEVAIAGTRVAWITRSVHGISLETSERLFTASGTGSGVRQLGHAFRVTRGMNQLWDGDWMTGLVGSAKVLAVSRWTETLLPDSSGTTITNARLSSIAKTGLRTIAVGDRTIVSRSADAGHVAVLRTDGTVGIYSPTGSLLREITPTSAQEIALGGGRLVVLTKAKTLEAYGSETGLLRESWPIEAKGLAGHLQAYGRVAIVSVDPRYVDRDLRVFDLKTGKSVTLPKQERSGWNDASVGPLGIVYAVNSHRAYGGHHPSGSLVFVSTARVLAGIARGQLK
jgi:hypothetical protein